VHTVIRQDNKAIRRGDAKSKIAVTAEARSAFRRKLYCRMSALGHKRTYAVQKCISALPPIPDMCSATRYVRFVPKADIPVWRIVTWRVKRRALRSITAWSHILTGCTGFTAFEAGTATSCSRDAPVEALLNLRRVNLLLR
jgi:hypothetical protein